MRGCVGRIVGYYERASRSCIVRAMRTALLLGATGLVGGHLLELLLADATYRQVTVLVRRTLGRTHEKLREVVVDFDRLDDARAELAVDDVFCCLGTTIKKAGSQEAFRRVDHDYPLRAAELAQAAGAGRYLVVTAVGANAKSGIFYNRVKGELEEALRGLSFPRGVVIVRPSILLGERAESRPAEAVGMAVMRATAFAFAGPLKRYRAIKAEDVARALVAAARADTSGVVAYEGAPLFDLAHAAAA
jgi:uncharacterized protein YbjT (DUF2867 family)